MSENNPLDMTPAQKPQQLVRTRRVLTGTENSSALTLASGLDGQTDDALHRRGHFREVHVRAHDFLVRGVPAETPSS